VNRLEKALLLATAGILTYGLVKQALTPSLPEYYYGKTVVITGGASGIGRAVVAKLQALGAEVLAVDRNAEMLASLATELPNVKTLQLDLARDDAATTLLEESLAILGRVDILISNAGIVYVKPFWEMTSAEIENLIKINLTSQIDLTLAFLPYLMEQGAGVIAYTGSLSAYVYAPAHSVYTGTKGGLKNFVQSLRRELEGSGVQLTIVHPNVTRTNLTDVGLFEMMENFMSLQTPSEVANAFLQGIAAGKLEVFVRVADLGYKWAEQLLPWGVDQVFRQIQAANPTRQTALPVTTSPVVD
jgi:short-subunit dehydrogenase